MYVLKGAFGGWWGWKSMYGGSMKCILVKERTEVEELGKMAEDTIGAHLSE